VSALLFQNISLMLFGYYRFTVFLGDDACLPPGTGSTSRGMLGGPTLICTVGTSRQNNPERSPGHHDRLDWQGPARALAPLAPQDRLPEGEITSTDSMLGKGILPEALHLGWRPGWPACGRSPT